MAFWNTQRIKESLRSQEPVILEGTGNVAAGERGVVEAAYELSLGPEAYISGAKEKTILENGGMVAIEPGQIAVLLTEERVAVPRSVLGFISLKSNIKISGLVSVSGFHVDPGFSGRLVFTVYNAGTETCAFTRGQKMFLIWFADLTGSEDRPHRGDRQDKMSIRGNDISRLAAEGASPARLKERLRRLEVYVQIYGALLLAFVLSAATLFIRGALQDRKAEPQQRNAPIAAQHGDEPERNSSSPVPPSAASSGQSELSHQDSQ
jgi:dCTP deaminase